MEHSLTAQDDGRELRVAVGDRLVVRLPENGGTGFLWELDVPAGLVLRTSEPEPAPLDAGVGGTGLHRFVLEVTESGRSAVTGRMAQPWAPDQVDATWSLVVAADEAATRG